jgi:signal transduction histidine kinase
VHLASALLFAPEIPAGIFILTTVPAVLASWLFGMRWGLVAAAMGIVANLLLVAGATNDELGDWLGRGGGIGLGVLVLVSGTVGRLRDLGIRLADARDELRALSAALVADQELVSAHLSRELHDDIGQTLTGLKLQLKASPDSRGVESARSLVAELMGKVADLSRQLRPAALDDLGLLPTLESHFDRYREQTGISVTFAHEGLDGGVPHEIETAAFRIVQESLTNVARHSGVQAAEVGLRAEGKMLRTLVEDHGQGFDPEPSEPGTGAGIIGMRERAAALGNSLRFESRPGHGTRVTAELPLPTPPKIT